MVISGRVIVHAPVCLRALGEPSAVAAQEDTSDEDGDLAHKPDEAELRQLRAKQEEYNKKKLHSIQTAERYRAQVCGPNRPFSKKSCMTDIYLQF